MAKQIVYRDCSRQGILRGINSLAIASLLLTTEAVISQIPDAHQHEAA